MSVHIYFNNNLYDFFQSKNLNIKNIFKALVVLFFFSKGPKKLFITATELYVTIEGEHEQRHLFSAIKYAV